MRVRRQARPPRARRARRARVARRGNLARHASEPRLARALVRADWKTRWTVGSEWKSASEVRHSLAHNRG